LTRIIVETIIEKGQSIPLFSATSQLHSNLLDIRYNHIPVICGLAWINRNWPTSTKRLTFNVWRSPEGIRQGSHLREVHTDVLFIFLDTTVRDNWICLRIAVARFSTAWITNGVFAIGSGLNHSNSNPHNQTVNTNIILGSSHKQSPLRLFVSTLPSPHTIRRRNHIFLPEKLFEARRCRVLPCWEAFVFEIYWEFGWRGLMCGWQRGIRLGSGTECKWTRSRDGWGVVGRELKGFSRGRCFRQEGSGDAAFVGICESGRSGA
jgi:hypothetical protein